MTLEFCIQFFQMKLNTKNKNDPNEEEKAHTFEGNNQIIDYVIKISGISFVSSSFYSITFRCVPFHSHTVDFHYLSLSTDGRRFFYLKKTPYQFRYQIKKSNLSSIKFSTRYSVFCHIVYSLVYFHLCSFIGLF